MHSQEKLLYIYFCVRKVVASPCMMSQRLATKSKPRHEKQAENGLFSLFPGPKFFCCCQHRADTTPPPFLLYTWHKDQEVCQLRNVIHLEELNIGLDDSLWFFILHWVQIILFQSEDVLKFVCIDFSSQHQKRRKALCIQTDLFLSCPKSKGSCPNTGIVCP